MEAIFSESPYLNQVNVNQRYLKDWLLGKNKQFAETFFSILREFDLIEYDDLDSYLEQAFYDDFVLTDLVKYRVTTQELSSSKGGNAELSCDAFLKPELMALDPDLVFCFGSYCWPVLYRNLDLEPVEGGAQAMTSTVTNAHGFIYESNSTYVLPLMHFSRQNQSLRNSYFEYLREGLANY